jgi:hypothetical protein
MGCVWEATRGTGDVQGGTSDVRGRHGPTVGALAYRPDVLRCSLANRAGIGRR